ncbi:MAG: hypothetical protein ACPL7K_08870, partial [Armatimonadota bacterium]
EVCVSGAGTSEAFGPDGDLYVADKLVGVRRRKSQTGAYLGMFTQGGPLDGASQAAWGLRALAFIAANNRVAADPQSFLALFGTTWVVLTRAIRNG